MRWSVDSTTWGSVIAEGSEGVTFALQLVGIHVLDQRLELDYQGSPRADCRVIKLHAWSAGHMGKTFDVDGSTTITPNDIFATTVVLALADVEWRVRDPLPIEEVDPRTDPRAAEGNL